MTLEEIHAPKGTDLGPVDVLVVTALQDELEGVLALGEGGKAGWRELRDRGGFRYYLRTFPGARSEALAVAAAWIGEMGGRAAALRGPPLLAELDPACLAMCGICAGYRKKVALGDVIVADQLYSYDDGKVAVRPGKPATEWHSLRTFDLPATWKMDAAFLARELDVSALSAARPVSRAGQRRWLLSALLSHEDAGAPAPAIDPDRKSRCPDWRDLVPETQRAGLVALQGGRLSLTAEGREQALNEKLVHIDGLPLEPPFQVHVGAIAAGSSVEEDPDLFERLRVLVRTTIGVEMEGATLGEMAARFERRVILVKAVSDHADQDKDDSFRAFACHASATVLLAFLQKYLEPESRPASPPEPWRERFDDPRRATDGERLGEGRRDGFLDRVERVAKLWNPGATLTRHRAAPPFAGVLEADVPEGGVVDVRLIGALEQPITEALFRQYQGEVEAPFRRESPFLRSTLVHMGPQAAPELLQDAARRGVFLKTFAEYQGLLDFTRYLAWQTKWLEKDPVYPPSLYVEQPARFSLAGGREEKATEHALGTLWDLVSEPQHPRFALVLGEFGAGKTFLLHELARRMGAKGAHPLVPVLVEMSKLEKQRSLRALLAQHFANADMGRFDLDAFMYMLAEGRIALLFDGFDELAQRLTYDRAVEHFDTVLQAAEGKESKAKVVLTSRTQHFLTDHQVRRMLAERAEKVPGYRLFALQKFGEAQIRRFLGNFVKDPKEAEERYQLLGEVKDLLGLSHNPRMLGFIAQIDPAKLREAREQSGEITAARLYEILVAQWLDFEHARANPPGAPKGITREKLGELVTRLAEVLWARNVKALPLAELGEVLVVDGLPPALVEHMVGSGSLLVRDAEGRFSFVHRSVMEWLVAKAAAREVTEKGDAAAFGADEMSELMTDFFVSMAGRGRAEQWAWQWCTGGKGAVGKNAGRVLRRIGVPAFVNLEGQDLGGQDFSEVDLRGANLARADLRKATLKGTRMTGASLAGARLGWADLKGANLEAADLTGADLSFARLSGADLRRARGLTAGQLRGAKLVGAQGVEVEGLAEVGAAPPVPGSAAPVQAPASECNTVAWSPSGDLVASGHEDGSVRIWDTVSGQALRTTYGHSGPIRSVAFSPDGKTLASGADDNTLRLWDVDSGTYLRAFEGHTKSVLSVAFSPDGKTLASGADDNTLRLWDVHSGTYLRAFEGHTNSVLSVAFSPDGKTLASGSSDNTLRLWDVHSGSYLRAFEGHTKSVRSVAFSPDGKTLASGSDDNTLRLWDVHSGSYLRAFEGHTKSVRSVAFSPDGKTLASGSDDNTLRLWDLDSGNTLRAFEGHTNSVCSVAFSPDGKTLASGSSDNTLRLWDLDSGNYLRAFEGHTKFVLSVAFSPDGKTLASGSSDNTLRLWDLDSGNTLRAFEGHTGPVWSVAFSPDGKTLASGSSDNTLRLWDLDSGNYLRAFEGHTKFVLSVAFSPDGKTLASGSSDNTLRLWDLDSGNYLRAFEGHTKSVWSVAFSPDGKTLASGSSDNTLRLWDVPSGSYLRAFKGHTNSVWSVAFSPDGKTLASGSDDNTLRLWDLDSGNTLRAFEGHTNSVCSVAFSPDGKTLASASSDNTLRLWDLDSGSYLRAFEGHTKSVSSVAFSPDGKTLASGSYDNTLRLWDPATARCLAILLATPEGWAAFTPDGRYKIGGDIAGSFWHVIGLCRFDPPELDPYLPGLRLPDDASFLTLPPAPHRDPSVR